ncbi:hypothetical protein F5879DRAFT_987219 [Lentinula edodes]|uniref:uncharacterized protein n=1 Tax=Lentinula edodes TaxID=5353 RepID=UPI001E8E41A1|nr:uncharacterized protein C8R40DRAFT_1170670 [Lentinula edodes]KAH7875040.1 hypothetical protein C8R40DRAFT_1170670 [Lentinula edodes]KAJ3906591.1 hypothetical protein F5879DRAFT_987219 [Lentinula edodes]KAJ3915232.1 hypothetical protein F5877DRAFT_82046 [Lentinula edodes]
MPKTPRKPRAHTGYAARHIGRPVKRKSRNRFPDRFHSATCEALCSNVGYAPEVVMSDITDLELLNSWQKCSVQDVLVEFRKIVDSSFVNDCVVCDMLFSRPFKACGHILCGACLNRLPREGVEVNIGSIHHHTCPICRGTVRSMPLKSDALQRTVGELFGLSTPRPEDMEIDDLGATRPNYS